MQKKLRIGVLDLAARAPTKGMFSRIMRANLASIMPQVVAVWCEQAGHEVHFDCYTGIGAPTDGLPEDLDLLFISAFTRSAQLAYAVSHLYRQRGAITALGGPHARCYPDDARLYFDYVLGVTDRSVVDDLVSDRSVHKPLGLCLSAAQQPRDLPGVRERWKFITKTLDKAPTRLKFVPMIGSLGCPYTCSFCIDSLVDYQPLEYAQIREDLKFIGRNMPNPRVLWHDPNFGIRFNDYLSVIEEAAPNGSIPFLAESTLSLLSEKNAMRLGKAGCLAILPGIESWYDLGNKSGTGRRQGEEKVLRVSEQVNMILRHIPYIQTNFVLGLDDDDGAEPFELTKRFITLSPGAFPAYSLLSAFGEAVPQNIGLQRAGRVLGFPHYFLDNNKAMNVRPKKYAWPEFYDLLIDLMEHSFSRGAVYRRFRATSRPIAKLMNAVRAYSSEGFFRLKYHRKLRGFMDTDRQVRNYLEQETDVIPDFYRNTVNRSLGAFAEYLPTGAMAHDQNAYSKKVDVRAQNAAQAVRLN